MRRGPLLAALFLTALALRPQLVGAGPLIPSIERALHTPHAVAGLLGTIPVLCMGLFAPPAAYLSQRFGSRRALAAAIALIGAFGLLRAGAPGVVALILLTVPVGIGMGVGNALLPVSVKERFADRPVFATGVYAAGINVGGTVSAAVAVPIAHALSSWRYPLLVFSLASLLLAPIWLASTRRERTSGRLTVPRPRALPWRSSFAWRLVLAFFLMSGTYYGLNAWLPDVYVEHGWSEGKAGALLAVLNGTQIAAGVGVAWLADRRGSRRTWLAGCASAQILGLLGIVLLPGGGWGWAALVGATTGPLFSLTMALPVDVGRSSADVAVFTGLMLGGGYSLSALSPLTLGAIRDASSSFDTVLWVLVGMSTALLLVHTSLSPERFERARLEYEPAQGAASM
ncbi:MAG TPA: MFS transporter [Gaiellaceae bacterium]|nr:MFS transporter [Gaiellaceae bacterium]